MKTVPHLAVLLAVASGAAPSTHAQLPEPLRQAQARANVLAGCFVLDTVAPTLDLRFPHHFRLGTELVRSLGYHRVGFFTTNIPKLSPSAETPPIWRPIADDSVFLDLAPRSINPMPFVIVAHVADSVLVGEFRYLKYRLRSPDSMALDTTVASVARLRARRVRCRMRMVPPNQRLKLSACGGRVVGSRSVLSAAAAGRSLSAFRYAAAAHEQ